MGAIFIQIMTLP
jgi:hypothetical protein